MTFYTIFFSVIGLCVVTLGLIFGRKFRQLSLIDTQSLPQERDAQKKKEIIAERVTRKVNEVGKWMKEITSPFFARLRLVFCKLHQKTLMLDHVYQEEDKDVLPIVQPKNIPTLFEEVAQLLKKSDFVEAEKKFIEILSLDEKNLEAYKGLGALYLETKRYEQARETFTFLVKVLRRQSGCIHELLMKDGTSRRECTALPEAHARMAKQYANLGSVSLATDDTIGAYNAFEKAVALETVNPRYLDLLFEACILVGNKSRATAVLLQLKAVNPENQKLDALAEKLALLPEPEVEYKKRKVLQVSR